MIEKFGDNIFLLFIIMDNKKPNGSSINTIKYLKEKFIKTPKSPKSPKKSPKKSPLSKRIIEKERSRLSIRCNRNLTINTNILYKGKKHAKT